jgi:hypothetical protein
MASLLLNRHRYLQGHSASRGYQKSLMNRWKLQVVDWDWEILENRSKPEAVD